MLEMIGRLYSIHPTQVQLYALRLLLNHVKGPRSFDDIRKVDGKLHDSFQSAAIALDLVKDDKMWIEGMKEANDYLQPFFSGDVIDHKSFDEQCKSFLDVDFMHQYSTQFEHHPLLKKYFENESGPSKDTTTDALRIILSRMVPIAARNGLLLNLPTINTFVMSNGCWPQKTSY
ncbi:hypothetical protein ACHAWF_001527 [Thalassiosira exigua]